MNKFDVSDWPNAAARRIQSISQKGGESEVEVNVTPPLSDKAVDALATQLALPIPAALKSFLVGACGGFSFRYRWEPNGDSGSALEDLFGGDGRVWGGGDFCLSTSFEEWIEDCKSWAEETWIADSEEDFELWTKSLPILRMENADVLALDLRTPSDDPAVIYLSHDEDSKIIAPTFTSFLREWSRLYCVGPEFWMIEPFLDDEGHLSAATAGAAELLNLLEK